MKYKNLVAILDKGVEVKWVKVCLFTKERYE